MISVGGGKFTAPDLGARSATTTVCERDDYDDDDDDDEIDYFSVPWKPESETTKVRLKTSFSLPHQNQELQVA